MKLFKYGLPFAALALLASCANDNVVDQPDPTPEPGQSAYLNVRIAMPAGTRAMGLDNGSSEEYAVNSDEPGYLILFSDAVNEGDAVCLYTINLKGWEGTTSSSPDVTVTNNYGTLKMEGVDKDKYLGLVVLNPTSAFSLPSKGQKFSEWADKDQMLSHAAVEGTSYLTMTSSLGWVGAANEVTGEPTVLTPIPSEAFFYGSTKPATSPSVTFYVSRIAAKVSLATGTNVTLKSEYEVTESSEQNSQKNGDKVTLTSWQVDGTNATTFPVQRIVAKNVKWTENTLFTDWKSIATNPATAITRFTYGTDYTRVNWAVDPNYASAGTFSFANAATTGEFSQTNHTDVVYPNENTFDLANMKQNQTTRVLFKATYIVNGETTAKSFVEYNGLKYAIDNSKLNDVDLTSKAKFSLSELISDPTELAAASTKLKISNTLAQVRLYKDGICYYEVRIRHFDADDLDLDSEGVFHLPTDSGYITGDKASAEEETAMLGRYGIVRNNSYSISLNGVVGPGSPTVPTPGDKPDDNPDPYNLNATINVLKWAQRTQGVVLGQ